MSKEEFLKIQKCVLKVNIHCDGCKHKVKKILQKIDGVFTTEIDAEQGKVVVSGNVDPNVLIKKLAKSGKHAELWGAPKPNNNQNLANQLKNMQIDKGNGGGNNNNKGQNQKGGGNNQPKGGGGQPGPNPQQLQLQQQQQLQQQLQQRQQLQQQLQQLQQMKGFQDLKLPQFKDMKLPPQNPNAKAVKFDMPEDEDDGFTDDELDDFDDDDEDYDDDDEFDDEMDELPPVNKMKGPPMGNGAPMALNGNHPMLMNATKGVPNGGGNGGGNGKKGGGDGPAPVPVQAQANGGGKKGGGGGGGGGGNGQNQGGGNKNIGGKNGGGAPQGKNGNNGGANMNGNIGNGGKTGNPMGGGGGGGHPVFAGGNVGPMGNMPIPMQMNHQMGNMPAVQGLPAAAVNGGGGGGGYFQGAGPDGMPGNPYHQQQQHAQAQAQQQYMAAMMNQQRAMGNERFQPMMYARPPPAVNYMYPPYTYPPPDPYTHFFSDENTSSCNVM